MLDLILRNGDVVDGTGKPRYRAPPPRLEQASFFANPCNGSIDRFDPKCAT